MESSHDFLLALGLDEQADERAIRRAYARRVKQIDQAADAAGFQALRDAYETAMSWAAYRQREALHAQHAAQAEVQPEVQSDSQPNAQPDPQPDAERTAQATALPEPAAAADSAPQAPAEAVAPAEEAPPMTPAEQALEVVWERYQAGVAELDAAHRLADEAAWKTILRTRLADDELINIDARMQFEWRIVYILGNGWRPGHEALFPAATEAFGWAEERRALAQFGYYGKLLNQAIDEHVLFQAQEITYRSVQQRIAMLLRREKPAETVEILHSTHEMELMHERFPALMLVVTNPANAEYWRTVYAENHVDEAPPQPSSSERFRHWWLYVSLTLIAFVVLNVIYNAADTKPEAPAPFAPALSEAPPLPAELTSHFAPLDYTPQDGSPENLTVSYEVYLTGDGSVNATDMLEPSSGDPAFDAAVAQAILNARPFPPSTPRLFRTTASFAFKPKPPQAGKTKPSMKEAAKQ